MNNTRLLGIEEVARYLDVSKSTLYSWVNQRKIGYTKIGRLVKFRAQEIENWLKEHSVEERDWAKEHGFKGRQ